MDTTDGIYAGKGFSCVDTVFFIKLCLRQRADRRSAVKGFRSAEASAARRVGCRCAMEWVDIRGEKKGLKIDSSTVGMESARSYTKASATVRRFVVTEYQGGLAQGSNTLNAAVSSNTQNTENPEETETNTEQTGTTLQDWQARFQATAAKINIRSSASQTVADIRQISIRYIFDMMFASRRNRLKQWMQENSIQTLEPIQLTTGVKMLNYSQETIRTEAEDTQFSTVGTVRTADGREISFNVNVGMSREFQQTFRDDLELASFTMCDPLVINLDTDIAELSDQTFYFDIDADGELDEVSRLGAGSGYLALDKNGDGVVNDGSELFGTASGNGFADLAKYDEDGNGWIDENDAIWEKLKIWTKDENGNDVLYRLADKGVGAICLQNVSTDFTLTGQEGQTKGAIRSSGVFLYENGNVGTVQHVDVAKYDKGA